MKNVMENEAYVPCILVAMVDNHAMVADSLCEKINRSDNIRVIKIYYDPESCRNGLTEKIPDVLLLEIEFPGNKTAGVDFCAEVSKVYPELKIIMLTGCKIFNIAKNALRNGAHGYILKNSEHKELIAGIKAVYMGKQFLCEKADALLKNRKKERLISLTPTEKIILKYLAKGHARKKIADLQCRSEGTIKIHVHNLRAKFSAKNVAELIKKASEMGFI